MDRRKALEAMRNGAKVKLMNAGREYKGKLVAAKGNEIDGMHFLFQGKSNKGEVISYSGGSNEFSLIERGR